MSRTYRIIRYQSIDGDLGQLPKKLWVYNGKCKDKKIRQIINKRCRRQDKWEIAEQIRQMEEDRIAALQEIEDYATELYMDDWDWVEPFEEEYDPLDHYDPLDYWEEDLLDFFKEQPRCPHCRRMY